MFGYSEARIKARAEKRGQTVDEHLAYLLEHQATRNERRREARKARAAELAALAKKGKVDTPSKA